MANKDINANHNYSQNAPQSEIDLLITIDDFIEQKAHGDFEVVASVRGPKAVSVNWEDIQTALTTILGPPEGDFYQVYRLEEPTRWFILLHERQTKEINGVGKTTLMTKIHQDLHSQGISCSGFITEEVRVSGRRTGFDVVTMGTGQRGQLARVSDAAQGMPLSTRRDIKVGQYSVNLMSFEQTALVTLKPPAQGSEHSTQVYLVDEIGKMELFSQSFVQAVRKLMSLPNVTLVATIPVPKGRPIPFVEELRAGEHALVFEVNRQNRDVIHTDILQAIKTSLSS